MRGTGKTAKGRWGFRRNRLAGSIRLESADLNECAADLKSRTHDGSEWLANITQRYGSDAFKIRATSRHRSSPQPSNWSTSMRLISSSSRSTLRPVRDIACGNSHSRTTKRSAIHTLCVTYSRSKIGDIFDRNTIAKGLEKLHYAYGELGYINFTSVPDDLFSKLIWMRASTFM